MILLGSPQGSAYPAVQEVAEAWFVGGEVMGLLANPFGPGGAACHYPPLLLHQDRHVSLTDVDGEVNLLACGGEEAVVLGEVGAGEERSQ